MVSMIRIRIYPSESYILMTIEQVYTASFGSQKLACMKKLLLCIPLLLSTYFSAGQIISDSVDMGPGYTNDVYYSLNNGVVHTTSNENWDLSFSIPLISGEIRINDGRGAKLYLYPHDDINGWTNVDTSGLSQWSPLYNSDEMWESTAFNQYTTGVLDQGWGIYNIITHVVTGDSIYILQTVDGDFKKLYIEELETIGGIYTFVYADIDGSNQKSVTLNKSDFAGKRFAYFSFATDTLIDRDATLGSWDLLFTKYLSRIYNQVENQIVTGVLTSGYSGNARAENVDISQNNWWNYPYDSTINLIGYEWKDLNYQTFQWEITDSLCYFTTDTNGSVFKLIFTGFEGTSTGKIYFTLEQIGQLSVEDVDLGIEELTIFPNPAREQLTIELKGDRIKNNLEVQIINLAGQTVRTERINHLHFHQTEVSDLESGIYLISIGNEEGRVVQKIIIQ